MGLQVAHGLMLSRSTICENAKHGKSAKLARPNTLCTYRARELPEPAKLRFEAVGSEIGFRGLHKPPARGAAEGKMTPWTDRYIVYQLGCSFPFIFPAECKH